MSVRILIGDVREQLRLLPADFFDCVVTSPPYWGLRSYLPKDHEDKHKEIGCERTLGEHLDVIVDVFSEVKRVMKPTATLWLNYGDCYAAAPNGRKAVDIVNDDRTFRDKPFSTVGAVYDREYEKTARVGKSQNQGHTAAAHGGRIMAAGGYLKPKDLCMIPNRLAIALQDAGWWVRSEIIWHKPNPMPESIKDRPGCSHEKVWLLSKSPRYFYDHEAVAEPSISGDLRKPYAPGQVDARGNGHDRGGRSLPKPKSERASGEVYTAKAYANPQSAPRGPNSNFGEFITRNLRNVWTIATAAFSEAHFATFPPELAERCIKAGCPAGGHVLDPFGGAGTTGLVADRLQRNATLIELNPEYAALAERRIHGDAPMFAEVTA